jgi:hypothetical protein
MIEAVNFLPLSDTGRLIPALALPSLVGRLASFLTLGAVPGEDAKDLKANGSVHRG